MKILLVILLLFLGCASNDVEKIYENRMSLLNICEDKALLKGRGNILVFKTFKNNQVNEYYLDFNGGQYSLKRDTLQYLSDVFGDKITQDSASYRTKVTNYVAQLAERLQLLNVEGFRTDFRSLGIPLKLYLKDRVSVLYVPGLSKNDKLDTKYKDGLKKIAKDWYYLKE